MQSYRVSALIVSLVVQVTVTCVSSEPTSMYIRLEPNSMNYRYVRFYNDTFQRLYNCMREKKTTQCNVKYVLRSSLPPASLPPAPPRQVYDGNDFIVQHVIFINGSHSDRGYFTCQLNYRVSVVECTRSTTSQCGGHMCISFRRRSSSICDTDCVYLLWKYQEEKLEFDDKTDKFDDCKLICAQTTNALIPSSQPSDSSTLRPAPTPDATANTPDATANTSDATANTSDATTNSSRAPAITETIASGSPPDNDVIIGVVCGVLCLVILGIAVGVIYRRQKQTKRHSGNNGVNSSRTDTNHDKRAAQHSEKSNFSNIPDALSTLPYLGHTTEKNASEEGYYTIDDAHKLHIYENALNTVSSKTSTINDDLNTHDFYVYQNELRLSPPIFHVQEGSTVN